MVDILTDEEKILYTKWLSEKNRHVAEAGSKTRTELDNIKTREKAAQKSISRWKKYDLRKQKENIQKTKELIDTTDHVDLWPVFKQVKFYCNIYYQTLCNIEPSSSSASSWTQQKKDTVNKFRKVMYMDMRKRDKFRLYIDNCISCIEEHETLIVKNINSIPKSLALTTIYIAQVLAGFGLTMIDIGHISIEGFSQKSTINVLSPRLVAVGIIEWYKNTDEYKEWEKHDKWLKANPSYYRKPSNDYQKLYFFKKLAANPIVRKNRMIKKI